MSRPDELASRAPEIRIPGGQDRPDFSHPPRNKLTDEFGDSIDRMMKELEPKTFGSTQPPVLPLLLQERRPSDIAISPETVRVVGAKVQPSSVEVYSGSGLFSGRGSGTVISQDGYVLTNAHVVRSAPQGLTVRTSDRREFAAQVVKIDYKHDLALLRTALPADSIHPIAFAANTPKPGEPVFGFGSPKQSVEANPNEYHFAISPGYYDHSGQLKEALNGYSVTERWNFLTGKELNEIEEAKNSSADVARVNEDQGSSGGALTNLKGQLVSVHFAGSLDSSGNRKVGDKYFKPLSEVKTFLSSTDPALKPEVRFSRDGAVSQLYDEFRAKPMEMGLKIGEYAAPTAVLLSGQIPVWTRNVPVLSAVGRVAHGITRGSIFTVGGLVGLGDLNDLTKSNNSRETLHSSLALLSDAGVVFGAGPFGKYRSIPVVLGVAGRIASELIPFYQTYY